MLSNADFASEQIGGLTEDIFSGTRTLVYAAARAVEIVGEAAAQIEPEVQKSLPSIPWRQAIGMRNKLIHGYRSLNSKTLYETIRDDFPPLIAEIRRILKEEAGS